MARSLSGLSIRPIALTKFVGTVSLGLLTGLSYTTTTLTLPSLHLLPSATTASNTTHHLRTATARRCTTLSLLSTLSLSLSYILSPRVRRHPFLLYAALTTALPLCVDMYNAYISATPTSSAGDGKINMRDTTTMPRQNSGNSSDEEWEVDASGMRVPGNNGNRTPAGDSSASDEEGGKVNGESVREGMRRWGQGVARRGVVWGCGFAIAVVGLWGDGA